MATQPHLPNFTLVGACVDILKIDPLHLAGAAESIKDAPRFTSLFDLTEMVDIPDADFSIPAVFHHQPASGGLSGTKSVELTSETDYQELIRSTGSLSVSDPTGELFAGTLSGTFKSMRQTAQTASTVVSYVSQRIDQFFLNVALDHPDLTLSPEVADALTRLPVSDAHAEYDDFVGRFGTHFIDLALYGGRALQRSSLSTSDYVTCTQSGVDIEAQVLATFELVRAKASAGRSDDRDTRFKKASSLKVETVNYVGGKTTQEFLDMWAMGVPEAPMPVEAQFRPVTDIFDIPGLLDPGIADEELEAQRRRLESAIVRHLESHGTDVTANRLCLGSHVTLGLAGPGPERRLSGDGDYCRTVTAPSAPTPAEVWRIVDPSGSEAEGTALGAGQQVAFVNLKSGAALDARAGKDSDYPVGAGLTGTDPAATTPAKRWSLRLATTSPRTVLADGDLVVVNSSWVDRTGKPGCLKGEADPADLRQRTYGFGRPGKPGTTWRLKTVEP